MAKKKTKKPGVARPPFDPDELFPPDEYEKIEDVPLIDVHKTNRIRNGEPLDLTEDFLQECCDNHNQQFSETGDAAPYVVSHTQPGKANENEILGYFVNFKLDPWFNTKRKGAHATLYAKRDKKDTLRRYPRRSVELWAGSKRFDPISALGSETPERYAGLLLFNKDPTAEEPYRYSLQEPNPPENRMDNSPDPNTQAAQFAESQPFRELIAKTEQFASTLVELKQENGAMKEQMMGLMQTVGQIMQIFDALSDEVDGQEPGAPDDLLGPSDPNSSAAAQPPSGGDQPTQFNYAAAGPNSGYTPSTIPEDKTKMSKENTPNPQDEVLKFQKIAEEAQSKTAKLEKENAEFKKALDVIQKQNRETAEKFAKAKAEQITTKLEVEDHIDFGEDREWHVEMFSKLDDASCEVMVSKIKNRYQKKLPNNGQEVEATKFARTEADSVQFKKPEDVQKFVDAHTKTGVSLEDYMKGLAGK